MPDTAISTLTETQKGLEALFMNGVQLGLYHTYP